MMYLISGANVYSPDALGKQDVLIAGGKIIAIENELTLTSQHVEVIDGQGMMLLPGLVDSLVHITGGGGEGGFHTRTPQMQLTEATLAGVTTVIGALGTDATTRSLPDLIAKARALDTEGITAYCYTGSYQLPARTVTGSITDDIVLIDKMIGIGEVAIADHRGSQPSAAELARVAADARVGGMLSGKSGVVCIHTGEAEEHLSLLHDVIDQYPVSSKQFYPTHLNRNQALLDAGIQWTQQGGVIDMTTSTNKEFIAKGEIPAAQAIAYCLQQGVDPRRLTMSSDGNASLPVFAADGSLCGLEVGRVQSLFDSLVELVTDHKVALPEALATVTRNPAVVTGLNHKGQIRVGNDADLILCSSEQLHATHVMGKGRWLVRDGQAVVKGTFE